MLQEITEQDVREMLLAKICRYGKRRRLQKDLAQQIGISGEMLSMILHGNRRPSSKVLKFLGVQRDITYWMPKNG